MNERADASDPMGLIGRDVLLAEVAARLDTPGVRLVTLTGPGGIGKTTLARAVAKAVGPAFPDGVAVVELAAERDPGRLPLALVQALGLDPTPGEPPLATLVHGLTGRRLLVVDNLEQVLGGVGMLVELLTGCPGLTLLATSRIRLGLVPEVELPVPPLTLPAPSAVPFDEIAASPAVRLFAQRARQANAAFTLSPGNSVAVAEVCRRLDGLPLALELGAARLNLLSADALLARLDARLDLLAGGPRDSPARHRSMRDAVGWSVDLLSETEQRLFAVFSVFTGGCTADDLAAVVAALGTGANEPAIDVPAAVRSLVAGSLLTTVADANGDPRLAMLESVRDVAAERLASAGMTADARRAHAARYLAVAERDGPVLRSDTVTQNRMWERLNADIDNVRAALAWFLGQGDAAGGLRLVAGLDWFWTASYFLVEGVGWLERLVAVAAAGPAVPADIWGNAHRLLALLLDWLGREVETERAVSVAIAALAVSTSYTVLIEVLLSASTAALEVGDLALARDRATRAMTLAEAHGGELAGAVDVIIGNIGQILAIVLMLQGETAAAVARAEAAIAQYRRIGEEGYMAMALDTLADAQMLGGDLTTAAANVAAALASALPSSGEGEGEGQFLRSIFTSSAQLAYRSGEAEVAARLFGAAAAEQRRTGVPARKPLQALVDADVDALRAGMGEARFSAAWAVGAAAPQAEQLALAERFLRDTLSPPLTGLLGELTARELDVLRLVAAGRTNREIGDALFISDQTASKHVSHVLAKLGLTTRTAAATYAAEHGLRPGAGYTASSG